MFALDFLRALAILLITNSHLDPFYPSPAFGTGGMFGNELFFFVSGFGLALSQSRRTVTFGAWYKKRARRVMVPMVIGVALLVATGYFPAPELAGWNAIPTLLKAFWFLPSIMVFYIPIYVLMRSDQPARIYAAIVAVALVWYAVAYTLAVRMDHFDVETPVVAKAPFYLLVMLLGVYAARNWRDVPARMADVALLVFATVGYAAVMVLMRRTGNFSCQFMVHVVGLVWVVAMYRSSRASWIEKLGVSRAAPIVRLLSRTSLWIYLLQEDFIQDKALQSLQFPLNVALFWILVLPSAWLFTEFDNTWIDRAFARFRPTRPLANEPVA